MGFTPLQVVVGVRRKWPDDTFVLSPWIVSQDGRLQLSQFLGRRGEYVWVKCVYQQFVSLGIGIVVFELFQHAGALKIDNTNSITDSNDMYKFASSQRLALSG
ncbi:hypothetical protein [Duganella caerulea]|uniref:hypothetical protein n=1 Tax=Duganella caerulea TaxID=2885762 RepID=UPI004037E0F7